MAIEMQNCTQEAKFGSVMFTQGCSAKCMPIWCIATLGKELWAQKRGRGMGYLIQAKTFHCTIADKSRDDRDMLKIIVPSSTSSLNLALTHPPQVTAVCVYRELVESR
jgi:hypothetical protein